MRGLLNTSPARPLTLLISISIACSMLFAISCRRGKGKGRSTIQTLPQCNTAILIQRSSVTLHASKLQHMSQYLGYVRGHNKEVQKTEQSFCICTFLADRIDSILPAGRKSNTGLLPVFSQQLFFFIFRNVDMVDWSIHLIESQSHPKCSS